MFKEFEEVRIKKNGITGVIVDKTFRDGKVWYVVESNSEGPLENGYGGKWPLFDCTDEDLEKVDSVQAGIRSEAVA